MYEYIYFSGGGIRAYYFYLGLLYDFQFEQQCLHKSKIKSFIGCSAGSMSLFQFLISDNPYDYIWTIHQFRIYPFLSHHIQDVVENQGLINRKKMIKFLHNMLTMRGLSPYVTLQEMYTKVGFYFAFQVYDFMNQQVIFLNPIDYGYITLVDAVMWSSHIPFITGTDKYRYFIDGDFHTGNYDVYQFTDTVTHKKCLTTPNGPLYKDNYTIYIPKKYQHQVFITEITRKKNVSFFQYEKKT